MPTIAELEAKIDRIIQQFTQVIEERDKRIKSLEASLDQVNVSLTEVYARQKDTRDLLLARLAQTNGDNLLDTHAGARHEGVDSSDSSPATKGRKRSNPKWVTLETGIYLDGKVYHVKYNNRYLGKFDTLEEAQRKKGQYVKGPSECK